MKNPVQDHKSVDCENHHFKVEKLHNDALILHRTCVWFDSMCIHSPLLQDSVSLHKKFIADCYKRLEVSVRNARRSPPRPRFPSATCAASDSCFVSQAASSALGGPTLTHAVTKATKMLTATAMPTVATSVQSPSRYRGGFG